MRITIKPFTLQGFHVRPELETVLFRIYALQYFIGQSDGNIYQPSDPQGGPFYQEWQCTRNNSTLTIPQLVVESTIDAVAPAHPESLRYFPGLYDPDGKYICTLWPFVAFALDLNPNPTSWPLIAAYNTPGVGYDWTTEYADCYSKEEFDYLYQNPPPPPPTFFTVLPPLNFSNGVLSIPRATSTQDGYLAAEDFILFSGGIPVAGVSSFNGRTGAITLTLTDVQTAQGFVALNKAGDTMGGNLTVPNIIVSGQLTISDGTNNQVVTFGPANSGGSGYRNLIVPNAGAADVTPPNILTGPTVTPTSGGATIVWTTNEASDSEVHYGTGTSMGSTSGVQQAVPPGTTNHNVTLSGLAANTQYYYTVTSKDAAGNPRTSAQASFTTLPTGGDTTPPLITAVNASSIDTANATITWLTTGEASDSEVKYSIDPDVSYGSTSGILNPVPPGVTSHSVHLTGLTPNKTYNFRVHSKDAAGNPAIAITGTFTTDAVVPGDELEELWNGGAGLQAPFGTSLDTGLVSFWRLDDATGANATDIHGPNTLINTGSVPSAAGKIGTAMDFSAGKYLSISDSSQVGLSPGNTDFTIAAWVYLTDKSADRYFLTKTGGSALTDEYILQYGVGPDRLGFVIQRGSVFPVLAADSFGSPPLNTWMFVLAWYDSATESMFIQVNNGQWDYRPAGFAGPVSGSGPFYLGSYNASVYNAGRLDAIGYWNRLLTAPVVTSERDALWNGGNGIEGPFTGPLAPMGMYLVSSWALNDLTDTRSLNTLTNVGGATVAAGKVAGGTCFEFNGSTQWLTKAAPTYLNLNPSGTACCWCYLTDKSTIRSPFSGAGGGDAFVIQYDNVADRMQFTIYAGGYYTAVANSFGSVPLNTWFFVLGEYDSVTGQVSIQINNGPIDTAPGSVGSPGSLLAMDAWIGTYRGATQPWAGRVDAPAFWSRVLS